MGALLFWGGLIGMGVFGAAGVVCWLVLARKRKKLLLAIEQEYQ